MTSINVDTLDGIFNPLYVMAESRYGENVMVETAVREDDVGVDLTNSLQKEGKEVVQQSRARA
jgi:hypothetical protein